MTEFAWRYCKAVEWFGILVFTRWNMPWLAHASAMAVIAMEANDA